MNVYQNVFQPVICVRLAMLALPSAVVSAEEDLHVRLQNAPL
jgi:hypothetical protein